MPEDAKIARINTILPCRAALILFSFFVTPLFCRISLFAQNIIHSDYLLWGLLSDLLWAGLLTLLVGSLRRWRALAAGFLWAVWTCIHLMDMENIIALGQLLHHSNLPYLFDREFVVNSIHALPATTLLSGAAVILLSLAFLLGGHRQAPAPGRRYRLAAVLALMSLAGILYQGSPLPQERWQVRNFFAQHVDEMAADALRRARGQQALPGNPSHPLFSEDLNAPRPDMGQAKNVLIIALEGITGAYLAPVAQHLNYPAPATMPGLSELARTAVLVPNFVSHNTQTMRGLYSMLCSDYPKLLNDTAKSFEILSNDTMADRCLPRILRKQGYSTHYFQAANLQFMSKDTVMPFIGFEDVRGRESFELPDDYALWGPDDERFFEQSLEWLDAINQGGQAWFATLLTVGTHHPYVLKPDSPHHRAQPGQPKLAAVLAADEAVSRLIQGLHDRGIDKDTLIIITSDESHGLPGNHFGVNWGLMMALAPDLQADLKEGVFATLDTGLSILDYLDIADHRPELTGRSLFRNYAAQRKLLFSQWSSLAYSTQKGRIILCPKQSRSFLWQLGLTEPCRLLIADNRQLFSRHYTDSDLPGDFQADSLFHLQQLADASLQNTQSGTGSAERKIVLNQDTRIKLKHNRLEDLLAGQFLSLPRRSRVRLQLELSFHGAAEASLSLTMRSTHLNRQPDQSTFLAPIQFPLLNSGEKLNLELSFATVNTFSHGQTLLRGRSFSGEGEVHIHSYTITIAPNTENFTPAARLDKGLIRSLNAEDAPDQLTLRSRGNAQDTFYTLLRSKVVPAGQALQFNDARTLAMYGATGFWPSEKWGSWSKAQASVYFALPEHLSNSWLHIEAQALLPEGALHMPTKVLINNVDVGELKFSRDFHLHRLAIPDHLKLGKHTEIRFELQGALVSPQQLESSNTDTRRLGLGIKSLTIAPDSGS